jgi:hypothetical protein
VGKHEGKRPLGKPRRRWQDNIKISQEVGCRGMDWTELAQDRDKWSALVNAELAQDRDKWSALVNAVMNLRIPSNSGNLLASGEPVTFSRRTLLHGLSE